MSPLALRPLGDWPSKRTMGMSAAPPLAHLYMDSLEKSLPKQYPIFWKRYIDDIFIIFDDKSKMDSFLLKYNELDEDGELPFV